MISQNNIQEVEKTYDLELNRILSEIKKVNAKIVLLQFPDGLKQWATSVVYYLREKTKEKIEFLIWFGSCYGSCDTPVLSKELEKQIDLVIQFGHSDIMPSY